jgi:hypothetical protein
MDARYFLNAGVVKKMCAWIQEILGIEMLSGGLINNMNVNI